MINDWSFWILKNLDLILKASFLMSSSIVGFYLVEIVRKQLKSEIVFQTLNFYILLSIGFLILSLLFN
jgi:hypothetical protein